MQILKTALNLFLASQATTNAFTFIGSTTRQTSVKSNSFECAKKQYNFIKPSLVVLSADGYLDSITGGGGDAAVAVEETETAEELVAAVEETVVAAAEDDDEAEEPASEPKPEPQGQPERAIEENKIYIGNLSYEIDEQSLREICEEYGTIQDISLPINRETGTIRGFGFVTYDDKETAQAAIDALQGREILGRPAYVNTAGKSSPQRKPGAKVEGTKLYVGNLSFDTSLDEVSEYFSNYGTVLDAYLPVDRETRNSRGFAFVTMSEAEALEAIDQTDGYEFNGRTLKVNKSLARGEKAPVTPRKQENGKKLYVGNLSFDTDQDTLESFFSEVGEVLDCYLPQDRNTGRSRGFAFVTMSDETADITIEETDGYELDGRHLRVNEAQPKGTFNAPAPNRGGDDWGNDGGNDDDSWDTDDSTWDIE